MTDAVSGVPLPPKRPTIIRPSLTTSTDEDTVRPVPQRPAPARPAPPPPGGGGGAKPPQVIPNKPPHKVTTDGESRRPAIPPPSASTIPPRPHTETNSSQFRGSVKKRPEITILSAKPMNEVGFRDEKNSKQDFTEKPGRPTRPVSTNQPGHDNQILSRPRPPQGHGRPPPPNRSSTSGPPTNHINLLDDDFGQSDLPPPIPVSEPPPLVANLLELEQDEPQTRFPPPVSRPPPPPPRPDPSGDSPPVPSRPPPLPARPKGTLDHDDDQPPPPPTRGSSIHRSQEELSSPMVASRGFPPVPAARPMLNQSVCDDDESSKFLPSKPLRPTIIRPGKPPASPQDARPALQNKTSSDYNRDDETKQPVMQKDFSKNDNTHEPEYARINKPKSKPNNTGQVINNGNSNEGENIGQGLPFKVKLRSTVTSPRDTSNGSQHDDDESPPALPPKHFEEDGSPSAAKPKPTVLPKPKPSDNEETNIVDDSKEKVQTSVLKSSGKRPTIIRPPPKPKRLNDTENDSESQDSGVNDSPETNSEVSMRRMMPVPAKRPNSINTSLEASKKDASEDGSTSPRPVPARRPVSVAARFEQQIQKENQSVVPMRRPPPPKKSPVTGKPESPPESIKSSTPGNESPHKQITPPKPKARSRTTPVDSSPESPSQAGDAAAARKHGSPEEATVAARPPPPRPSGRPRSMIIPKTPESERDNEETPKAPPPRPAGRPLSMVVPKHMSGEPTKDDNDDSSRFKPPRPGGGPAQVTARRKTSEEVFGEEEENSPKTGPPRPVNIVAPRRTLDEASPEEEDDGNKAKPPRPAGPPPPKHSPPQKDEDATQKKPPRPHGGPPRPMSTPVKPPSASGGLSRSRPPKPSHARSGGKTPDLPPRPGPEHQLYHYVLTVPHAIAKHDYTGSQEDELSFKMEEVVVLIRRIDSDWLVGRVSDREGMFPAGFVDIIHPLHDEIPDSAMKQPAMPSWDSPEPVKKSPSVTSGPRCVARFDFDGEGKDDLMFEEDEVIKLIGRVGTEWLKGELNGKTGIFPVSFVEIVEDLPPETVEKSADGLVTAMFDFDGRDNELSFQAGQKLKVIGQINIEWLFGEADGQRGKFPSAFIDYIPSDLPNYEPANQDAEKVSPEAVSAIQDTDAVDTHLEPMKETLSSSSDESQPYCVAMHDFQGHHDEDLSFKTGEIIQLLKRVGEDWLKGSCNGREGMFPAGFVKIERDLPESSDPPLGGAVDSSSTVQARALYDFDGESDKELTFKTGEIIILGDVVVGSPDWQYGSIEGRTGMFPTAFMEVIS